MCTILHWTPGNEALKFWCSTYIFEGLPRWLNGKEPTCNAEDAGDVGSIPGSGISPGGGNGYPFQYFCLENSMDGGAWWATVHVTTKSQM